MSRLGDLRQHIQKTLDLIAEHEKLIQTAQFPEERLRSRRWIARHRENIAQWVTEARRICAQESGRCPKWLLEAEASVPAAISKGTQDSLSKEQPKRTERHPVSPTATDQSIEHRKALSVITNPKAIYLPLSVEEGEDIMHSWQKEMIEFACVSVTLEKTRRILLRRSTFRPGEFQQAGMSIEQTGYRAEQLKQMVTDTTEDLPHPTLEPRALDDLEHIAALSERVVEALDNLDIETSLDEPASGRWLEEAERNIRSLDHYIASACDWMTLSVA